MFFAFFFPLFVENQSQHVARHHHVIVVLLLPLVVVHLPLLPVIVVILVLLPLVVILVLLLVVAPLDLQHDVKVHQTKLSFYFVHCFFN